MAEKGETSKTQVTKRIFSSYFGRLVHSSRNEEVKEEENLRLKRRADRKQKVRSLIVVDITSGNNNDRGNVENDRANLSDLQFHKGNSDEFAKNDDLGNF